MYPVDLSVMLICVFISLFQCTQAEAQLQASEKRLAEILEKEAGNLQEGSSFVPPLFFPSMQHSF